MEIEAASVDWVVAVINRYSPQTRHAAGEEHLPFPALTALPPGPAASVNLPDLVDMAQRLWPVFGEVDQAARSHRLNELVRAAAISPSFKADGTLAWYTLSPMQVPFANCIATVLDLVIEDGWSRIGTCAGEDCLDVFVSRSGRGSRRIYCSSTCLNRGRVRAFRARQRYER